MGTWRTTLLAVGLLVSSVMPAAAQEALAERAHAEQLAEAEQWMQAFAEWQDWWAQWGGRPQPGVFSGFQERRQKPAPPVWLAARCADPFHDSSWNQACEVLRVSREEGGAEQIRQTRVASVTQGEQPTRTMWWENVHIDMMWPAVQFQNSIYGVVGTHMTTTVAGRLQVYTAPGAMLLNVPTINGARVWKVAANYGIGYRLINFTFPGGQPAELHFNLAKMWILSDATQLVTGRTVDFAGFSVTFRRTR